MPPPQVEEIRPASSIRGHRQPQVAARSMTGRPNSFQIGSSGARFIPTGAQKGFQPMPMGGGTLGQIRLVNRLQPQRPSSLGQVVMRSDRTTGRLPEEAIDPSKITEGQVQQSIYRRKAWGRFKKLDAAEMAAYLKNIEERMYKRGIPPGIVEQIRRRLEEFVDSAVPDTQELTLSEQEVVALDNSIMYLEQEEAEATPILGTAAVVVAGLGILALAIVG
jgi:hypothetical protein